MKTIIIVTHDVDMLYEITDDVVVLNEGEVANFGTKIDVFSNVDLLNKNNAPVPSVVRMCKMIYDKKGIDLGYIKNTNELVRSIVGCFDRNKEGD